MLFGLLLETIKVTGIYLVHHSGLLLDAAHDVQSNRSAIMQQEQNIEDVKSHLRIILLAIAGLVIFNIAVTLLL